MTGAHSWRQGGRSASMLLAAVLLLAATTGCTAFSTRSQQVWRSLADYDYPSEPVGTPAFEAALDAYTESSARPGTAARLLQNGDEAYPVMLALIESAKTRISIETYIVSRDDTTDQFFDALRAAAARGVEVRVMADAAGFRRSTLADLRELADDGVQARVFNPYFFSWTIVRGNNRDHRKILVVDGRHAVLGGINIADDQAGDGISGWRDTSLLVSGPVAADAERVFAETWAQAGRGFVGKKLPIAVLNPFKEAVDTPFEYVLGDVRFDPPPYSPPPVPAEADAPGGYHTLDASVRVVASRPDSWNSTTYDLAILGVHGARERLDVACAYFVPPLGLRRALLAAAERGVRVRLLLPGPTDVKWVREIGMRFYGELLEAGVEIYEWPYHILHAKTMAVDGRWVVVGSANMDGRSYFLNYEACLAATDRKLAEAAHAQFEADLRQARPYTLEMWKDRGARQVLRETLLTPLSGQY